MSFVRSASIGLVLMMFGSVTLSEAGAADARSNRGAKTERNKPTEVKFPEATRAEPKGSVSSRMSASINRLIKTFNDDQHEKTIELADEILANAKANDFERAKAAQIAAYSWNSSDGDNAYPESMRYIKMGLEANALPNDDHYEMMYMLSQLQLAEEQYEDALNTTERFLAETKSNRTGALAVRGNSLYRLDRFAEAADAFKQAIEADETTDKNMTQMLMASYFELGQPAEAAKIAETLVAKNPNDKALLLNLVNIYLQADMPVKAGETFDRIRNQGLLTESRDYENAYKLLANIDGREKDAVAMINEGLDKGILTPNFEAYNYLGQAYYFSEQVDKALVAWGKAAPLAKDGETYLNLAKVQVMEERYDAAKAAAKQALAKGVKKPGEAWMAIARAEYGNDGKNRAAVLEAYREAAKYPETQAQASKAIAQMSR